ncbi:MAG: HPr family phosphocarrier protein [bacterium]|uniref:Phosphotransferase system, mannose/fructose/N-acetylgalactosamine n=2 Tax=Bacteria candidate phyla TaxID=1783234 RepID=A0A101I0G9_UNCT6|nr:MAG: Phosphotransferase system, mannose/fructose/N-acetylgalactosamine [candidate division TA06 bacterium 32_111]KUK86766.1 MAG: Phosphotransferase system, mannose/fructose/N-acetylgalactosamine [candidate division TA06 bacterium 34_109]MDI6700264.1 HPr family phosphocarrier protein [bacterium]HAF08302.1 phosphocarrier protein HPr [candidate division WOR-3 bacterium]HCP16556.1 phosphocarrier protein HPr [candidate division WOR-3 bacterium]
MIEKELIVKNKLGLHARPAALLVKSMGKFESKIEILRDDLLVDGKSIMGIMMLAAEQGAKLTFRIDGPDENEAMNAVIELFEKGFYEE